MKWVRMSRCAAGASARYLLSVCLVAGTTVGHAVAQQAPSPPGSGTVTTSGVVTIEQLPAGAEVLMRGPVHQAFAQPYPEDEPMMRVEQPVPAPLRERPAAARPSDPERTAQWIPGYWAVDPESDDLLWVSGIWRFPPPGMQWVPGYWNTRGAVSTWVSGLWVDEQIEELEFVTRPPEPRETAPVDEPPSESHFWVPGYWVYERGEFVWEPGTWGEAERGWVWEPARYLQTPSGWVFADGYWDYEPADRGLLFAPVRFDRETTRVTQDVRRPVVLEETYWPQVAIEPRHALVHWFTQPAYTHYYFGNYYDRGFAQRGIVPWVGYQQRATYYDPLFWYFRAAQPALLSQLVQSRNRVIAQPTLQPAAVFRTDIAAAQLPDFVQTVDMLTQGDRADSFTRVEAGVLDEYSEQLRQYDVFTNERLALRAELGDEGAARVQTEQRQLSEQTRPAQDAVDRLRTDEPRSLDLRGDLRQQHSETDRAAAPREQAQRSDAALPEPRGDQPPAQARPTNPPRRADAPAAADRPAERLQETREDLREQRREDRPAEALRQQTAPADPRLGTGVQVVPSVTPQQWMNLDRLRQIQMPEGLPRAQGVPQGQQPQFTPPQRLGRPGLLPGRGAPGQGRPGLLRRGR